MGPAPASVEPVPAALYTHQRETHNMCVRWERAKQAAEGGICARATGHLLNPAAAAPGAAWICWSRLCPFMAITQPARMLPRPQRARTRVTRVCQPGRSRHHVRATSRTHIQRGLRLHTQHLMPNTAREDAAAMGGTSPRQTPAKQPPLALVQHEHHKC